MSADGAPPGPPAPPQFWEMVPSVRLGRLAEGSEISD